MESRGECSTDDGVCEGEGIIREGTLADGPVTGGVFTDAAAEERVLSRDLERFDEGVGDAGTANGVDMFPGLALVPAPLRAPLRRTARNLCGLRAFVPGSRVCDRMYSTLDVCLKEKVADVTLSMLVVARIDCFCRFGRVGIYGGCKASR